MKIYVNDIIVGDTNESIYKDFSNMIPNKSEMSMMVELRYFLGFQIHQ